MDGVSVIIPAYNEVEHIGGVLASVEEVMKTTGRPYELIVVDDGSDDGTGREAGSRGVRVIRHEMNRGYGRSLKDAIRAARNPIIILTDADGTYDIGAIPDMIRLFGGADMVVGKRIFLNKSRDRFKNIWRSFFANLVTYYCRVKVEDLNSGQRLFRRADVVDEMEGFPDGFSFSSTLTVRHICSGRKLAYVPVGYAPRGTGSKFVSRAQLSSIAGLAFRLTFGRAPVKLSCQLLLVAAGSALLAHMLGSLSSAGLALRFVYFTLFLPFSFLMLLFFIHVMGSRPGRF